jgi:peroxiredoxin
MLQDRTGQAVLRSPSAPVTDSDWKDVTTDELFKGKTVIVFSLPGAFTPTCSSTHVPRFNQLAPAFKANGVDDIICMSVNDGFVMKAWQEDENADNLTFIPDGNGEFTEGMGLLVDKDDLGFGKRSWRYSMLVKDGVVDKMFIEPEEPGDPFHVSDADTMFAYVAPNAPSRPTSPCSPARLPLLRQGQGMLKRRRHAVRGAGAEPRLHRGDAARRRRRHQRAAGLVNGEKIGGSDDLERWMASQGA